MIDVQATNNRVLILADDLTGALDTSAVLRAQGYPAVVLLDPAELATTPADVIALTTETRHNPNPAPALRRLADMLPTDRLWYKKIDSTLRGAFGIEIATLLDCSAADAALVVPALPSQGRGLRDGHLVVHGMAQATHLPDLLHVQTGRPIDHVVLQQVRAGSSTLRQTLAQVLVPGAIVAVDAMLDGDLRIIAEAVAAINTRLLLAGSAGLAAWLSQAWHLVPQTRQQPQVAAAAPILYVLGSPNARTWAQIEVLRREVITIEIEPETPQQSDSIIPLATEILARGHDVALVLAAQADFQIDAVASETQQQVARTLASLIGRIMEATTPGSLIVGGGDTAFAVCQELGIRAITLEGEAAPGLPLGHATTATGQRLRVVTKAGGFGSDEALLVARDVLHGQRQSSEKETT